MSKEKQFQWVFYGWNPCNWVVPRGNTGPFPEEGPNKGCTYRWCFCLGFGELRRWEK